MATYTTKGIVIGRTNLGESDRVIRFLTADRGKIAAVARGVRKLKSRNAGHLELFGEVDLMLAQGRGSLDVVTQARLSWYPHHLEGAYPAMGLAFMACTMVDRLIEDGHAQPEAYHLLRELLSVADQRLTGSLPELWFKLRILHVLGYRPELSACINCGRSSADAHYSFNAERGGIMDEACAGATDRPLSHTIIKLWRFLSDHTFASAIRIHGAEDLATDSLALCDQFYEYHLGRTFAAHIA